MKRFIGPLICIFSFFLVNAQSGFEGGIFIGLCNYHGDLVDGAIELKESSIGYGFFTKYNVSSEFAVKANFYGGKLKGTDANSSQQGRVDRGLNFESTLYEIGISLEWFVLNTFEDDRATNYYNDKFNPFLFVGISVLNFNPVVGVNHEDAVVPEDFTVSNYNGSVPMGVGFKYNLSKRSNMGLELGFRTAFTDLLDGVSERGNPDKNDWYMFAGLNFSFFFSRDYWDSKSTERKRYRD